MLLLKYDNLNHFTNNCELCRTQCTCKNLQVFIEESFMFYLKNSHLKINSKQFLQKYQIKYKFLEEDLKKKFVKSERIIIKPLLKKTFASQSKWIIHLSQKQ